MSAPATDGAHDHSEAEIMILLSNRIRRRAIEILRVSRSDLRVTDIAGRITAEDGLRESDARRAELADEQLPRLAAAGVIEFDETAGVVRRGPNFGRFVGVIESVGEEDRPWAGS